MQMQRKLSKCPFWEVKIDAEKNVNPGKDLVIYNTLYVNS